MPTINNELLTTAKQELEAVTLAADGFRDPSLPNAGRTDQWNQVVQNRFQKFRNPLLNKMYSLAVIPNYAGEIVTSYVIGSLSDEDFSLQSTTPTKEVQWGEKSSRLSIGKAGAKKEWEADELTRKINLAKMNGLVLSDTNELASPMSKSIAAITSTISRFISSKLWKGTLPSDGSFGLVGLYTQFTKFNTTTAVVGAENARYNNITYANTSIGYNQFFTNLVARFNNLADNAGVDEITVKFGYGNMQKMIEAYYKSYLGITIQRQDYSSKGIELISREVTPDINNPWLKFMEIADMGAGEIMAYASMIDGQEKYERHAFADMETGPKELEIFIRTDRPAIAKNAGFPGELIPLSNDDRNGIVQVEMITYPAFAFTGVGLSTYYSACQFIAGPTVIDALNPSLRDDTVANVDFTKK